MQASRRIVLPTCRVGLKTRSAPGRFFGSYVVNRVLAIRLVQWLSWVFATHDDDDCFYYYKK